MVIPHYFADMTEITQRLKQMICDLQIRGEIKSPQNNTGIHIFQNVFFVTLHFSVTLIIIDQINRLLLSYSEST